MQRRQFLAAAAAGLPALAGAQSAPPARKPNIVLIYADDIGYGDLSCYGAASVRTPNLDRLAAEGIRFTNAHSTSATCTPSRYSLLTGEYAWRKPGTAVLPGDANLIIPTGSTTLATMLRGAGYRTGVVGKWHLGLGSGKVDWNREITPGPREVGFDYSFLIPATGDRVPCVYVENGKVVGLSAKDPIEVNYEKPFPGIPVGKESPDLLKMHPSHGHDQAIVNGVSRIGYMKGGKSALWVDEEMADVITRKATDFVSHGGTQPFFLYFATHDIHVPRLPNRRFTGKTSMGPRGDAIAELDWSVGQILQLLDRRKLTNDTLVIFSSDNGPVVDDGYRDAAAEMLGAHRPAGPLRGGKYSAFDGGTRVPFLLRWPGQVRAGGTSDALLSQVDLLASFAALTGQKLGADAAPDSFDTLPAFLGKSNEGREYLIEHAGTIGVISGNWKLIPASEKPKRNNNTNTELGNDQEVQLYDLSEDTGEKNNVAAKFPDKVIALSAILMKVRNAARTRP